MSVKKIPKKEQSLLCASVYVNSFQKAIEELVYNSLDADSNSIAIRVSLQENFIQVLDNGIGISKDNFRLLGHKYATSKFVDVTTLKSAPDKFGFRGMSLASIIEISETVKICSKFNNSDETWMKIFFKGKEENACSTTERPSKGTTVEIKGFLYNLNIQKKSIDPIKELNSIKLSLEQLCLIHCNVSTSLKDDFKNEIIFRINKNRDIYQTLESLFDIKWTDFQDIQVEKNQYKVKAIIGNQNENLKKYQWLYLNGRIVFKTPLHKKLNDYFTKTNKVNKKMKHKNQFADEYILFDSNLPFYFIFISCPYFDFDIIYKNKQTFVEFKNWQEIDKLIEKLVQVYHGRTNLKLVKSDKNIKINESECSENDTRKKVKEIMERILNKNTVNKPKISQLRKGVKGKNIKRKKKKVADVSLSKITKKRINIENKQLSNNKMKQHNGTINLSRITTPNKIIEESRDQILSKDTQVHLKLTPKNSQEDTVYEKFTKLNKHKEFIQRDKIINYQKPLLNKFAEQTESIKKRCKTLSYEAKRNLQNIKIKNDMHEFTMEYKNVFSDSGNRHFYIGTYEYSSMNSNNYNYPKKYIYEDQENHLKNIYCNMKDCKTSYDLIKPATDFINTVNTKTRAKVSENVIFKQYNQSYFASHESFVHIPTFNSHQNVNQSLFHEEREKEVRHSTTTKAPKNIFLKENKIHQTLNKKINKQKMRKNQNFKKIIGTAMNLAAENIKTPIYSSDMHMCNNLMAQSEHNFLRDITANLKNQSNDIVQDMNSSLNIKYASTYTVKVLGKSVTTNRQYNETYTIQNCNYTREETERAYSPSVFTHNETLPFDKSANKSTYFVAESQSDGVESLDPLNYCETVLNDDDLHDIKQGVNNESGDRSQSVQQQSKNNSNVSLQTDFNNKDLNNKNKDTEIISTVCTIFDKIENNCNNQKNYNKLENEMLIINDTNKISNELNTFQLKARHSFVPKGMSPIFKNTMHKRSYAYDIQLDYFDNDLYKNFAEDVLINHEIFEADVVNIRDVATKDINNVNNRISKDHADLIFNSTSLKYVKVLGQVDGKFIVCLLRGNSTEDDNHSVFLALFDQHAVDERVRLESNLKDYFDGNEWKSVSIDSEMKINLTKENFLYFHNHKEKFSAFGLQWTSNDNEILVNAIPEAILGKNMREVDTVIKAVKNLILEQIDVIKSLKGNVSSYPKTIMDLVFSEACRYAIKFGDKLTKTDCVEMINKLADCMNPFQCAHGRPVMAILTELTDINIDYKVNFNKIKDFMNKK